MSSKTDMTSTKRVTLTIKEFIGVSLFLLTAGISIGGFVKVISDINNLTTKVDVILKDITEIKVQNAKLETIIGKNEK